MTEKTTILEGIISDIGATLYQKWWNSLPVEDQTEEKSKTLARKAGETAFWVIQEFMNRFNAAAEELKPLDDTENN